MNANARRELPKGFEGLWIPRSIVELGLPPIQQMILAEVSALEGGRGCFASNSHFHPLIGVGDRSVRKHITALEDAGHLYTEGRDSGRRRMWLVSDLSAAIKARRRSDGAAATKPTRNGNAEPSTTGNAKATTTRQLSAAQPGTDCANPERRERKQLGILIQKF